MRAICMVALIACGPSLPEIVNVGRGNLEKGGVAIDGFTCGEKFSRAVAGVPEAEQQIRACWQDNTIYGVGMLGGLLLVSGAAVTRHFGGSYTDVDLELGAAATTFLVGYIAAWLSGYHLDRAIRVYDDAIERH